MSTAQIWRTSSSDSKASLALAAQVGACLRGGEVIELVSDLGGGKTTLVRGLVQGAGSPDKVHSPSFTLSNQYRAGQLRLYHFDFYRLEQPGIMRQELAEVLNDPQAVVMVEWPEIIEDVLPPIHLTIRIKPTSDTGREISFEYLNELKYLIPANA